MTAFELLALVLVLGLVGALCGWVGGAGARLVFSVRLDRVEHAVMQILNRSKGSAGQAVAQRQRDRFSSREQEAEQLAAKLTARRGLFGRRAASPIDAAEDQAFAEIEAEKEKRKAAEKGS